MHPSNHGAYSASSLLTCVYCLSAGTSTVCAHLNIISASLEVFLLIVSKDLSNLSLHSLTPVPCAQVQIYKPKASMEPQSFVLFSPYGSKRSCKFRKASRDIRKLSMHLVGSSRLDFIH